MTRLAYQRGMTLLELLVTLTIVAIITTFAVPGMSRMINSQTTISQTSKLNAALAYARSEAVARSGDVAMCATTNGTTCSGGTSWSEGWIIYTENNNQAGLQAGDEILKVQQDLPQSARLAADTGYVRFNNMGRPINDSGRLMESLAQANAIEFQLCDRAAAEDTSRVVRLSNTGSTRTTKGNAACPAS